MAISSNWSTVLSIVLVCVSISMTKTCPAIKPAAPEPLLTLEGHDLHVRSVAFSPDGRYLASGSADRSIALWNLQTGLIQTTYRIKEGTFSRLAFSPDGKSLAVANANGSLPSTVCLWNIETGKLDAELSGFESAIYAIAFSSDGKSLVAGGREGMRSWDPRSGRQLAVLKTDSWIQRIALNPKKPECAAIMISDQLVIW